MSVEDFIRYFTLITYVDLVIELPYFHCSNSSVCIVQLTIDRDINHSNDQVPQNFCMLRALGKWTAQTGGGDSDPDTSHCF